MNRASCCGNDTMPQRQTWTIYCAQQRVPSRAISGFEDSERSLLRSSAKRSQAAASRASSTVDAEPGRTSNCSAATAARSDSICPRPACVSAAQAGRTRLARASVTAAPFPSGFFDLVTSFDVLYSLEEPDEQAAVAEMFRLVRGGGFVAGERRGDGHSPRRSFGAQPRASSLQPRIAARASGLCRLHDRPAHLHERDAVPATRGASRGSENAWARGRKRRLSERFQCRRLR